MPRLDKTGPEGKGSKTGRGLGYCNKEKSTESNTRSQRWFSRKRPERRRGLWKKHE